VATIETIERALAPVATIETEVPTPEPMLTSELVETAPPLIATSETVDLQTTAPVQSPGRPSTIDADEPRKIYAHADVKSLGLTLAGLPPDTVTIKTITPDSWAAQQGLERGTRIIKVNGQLASSLTTDEVKGCLRQRPIEMEILPPEDEGGQENIAGRRSIVVDSSEPRVDRASTAP